MKVFVFKQLQYKTKYLSQTRNAYRTLNGRYIKGIFNERINHKQSCSKFS